MLLLSISMKVWAYNSTDGSGFARTKTQNFLIEEAELGSIPEFIDRTLRIQDEAKHIEDVRVSIRRAPKQRNPNLAEVMSDVEYRATSWECHAAQQLENPDEYRG
jgi:hypothetical protein